MDVFFYAVLATLALMLVCFAFRYACSLVVFVVFKTIDLMFGTRLWKGIW